LLWEAVMLGLFTGWLRKGTIKQLNHIYIITWPLIVLALFIQGAIWVDFTFQVLYLNSLYPFLYTGSFILLLASIIPHRHDIGLLVIGSGILLNLIVIAANGGMMPVDGTALPAEVLESLAAGKKSPFHTPIDAETLLPFLGDRITLFYRPNQLLSLGDLVLGTGIFIFIQQKMLKNEDTTKEEQKNGRAS